jgi:adenylate kinase family enzyme
MVAIKKNLLWVYVMGMPGAGKTSLVNALCMDSRYSAFLGGAFLRKILNQDNCLLKERIKFVMSRGVPLEFPLMKEIVNDFLIFNSNEVVVFDGFPRDKEYYLGLKELEIKYEVKKSVYINIILDEDASWERVASRSRGAVYARFDDVEKVFKLKVKAYKDLYMEAINQLKLNEKYFEIDGSLDLTITTKQVSSLVLDA